MGRKARRGGCCPPPLHAQPPSLALPVACSTRTRRCWAHCSPGLGGGLEGSRGKVAVDPSCSHSREGKGEGVGL